MAKKIADIYDGSLAIWKVNVKELREQDKNARVMEKRKFDILSDNIRKDNRLESLPYCSAPDDKGMFHIISGHHRVRSARQAGVEEIIILADSKELTKGEIKAKQIAHNNLSGFDDPQTLLELYNEIDDVNARIETGISDEDFKQLKQYKVPSISLDFDYEEMTILFLKSGYDEFLNVLERLDKEEYYIADKRDFEKYVKTVQKLGKEYNIKNIASIMVKMIEIVKEHLDNIEKEDKDGN
jgi:hypothetical protein